MIPGDIPCNAPCDYKPCRHNYCGLCTDNAPCDERISDDQPEQNCTVLRPYTMVDMICAPESHSHKPRRDWKKSQKKIRRERRQKGGRR